MEKAYCFVNVIEVKFEYICIQYLCIHKNYNELERIFVEPNAVANGETEPGTSFGVRFSDVFFLSLISVV